MDKYVYGLNSNISSIIVNATYYFSDCPLLWSLSQNSAALEYNLLNICITQLSPSSVISSFGDRDPEALGRDTQPSRMVSPFRCPQHSLSKLNVFGHDCV